MISKSQYKKLIEYIQKDFKRDSDGKVIHIKTDKTYGLTDSFYEAKGSPIISCLPVTARPTPVLSMLV